MSKGREEKCGTNRVRQKIVILIYFYQHFVCYQHLYSYLTQCLIKSQAEQKIMEANPDIVLNRTHYATNNSECGKYRDRRRHSNEISKGWNCPPNRPYEPFGELANVYKGCKIIKRRFQKFSLDLDLPQKIKGCRFLMGKDQLLDFVEADKNEKQEHNMRFKSRLGDYKAQTTKNARTGNNIQTERISKWLFQRPSLSINDDGIEILKKELADSFVRLKEVRRGKPIKEIAHNHPPTFYASDKSEYDNSFALSVNKWPALNFLQSSPKVDKRPNTIQNSPVSRRRKELSIRKLDSAIVGQGEYRIPRKKNELRETMYPTTSNNQTHEISMENSKKIQPYIKLASLRELSENNESKHKSTTLGIAGKFDPLKLVETIDAELDRLLQEQMRRKKLSRKTLPCAFIGTIRKKAQGKFRISAALTGNTKAVQRWRFISQKKVAPFTPTEPLPKKPVPKKPCNTNLTEFYTTMDKGLNTTIKIVESCEKYDKKKQEIKEKLLDSLDTQSNNRPKTLLYKGNNLQVKGMNSRFEYEILKMRTNAEKEKVKEYIATLKTHARTYYALVKKLLRDRSELHQDIHYVMDYYKTLIESGEIIGPSHIHYLMQNVYPSEIPQQITEYIKNKQK
eukprot:TRINITY_DN1335_c0_g1_i1.p1 TRINITY_DN1335_c0_g1~~TRINITY_DN1335_c0_g1_i1.p1  ORF type:complete len:622 (-),score=43.87 TRINITY_DN1335_c0_g1_i1:1840-3705(-)